MSTFTGVRELGPRIPNYNMEVFREPRGVVRIIQLAITLFTMYVLRSYEGYIDIEFCDKNNASHVRLPIEYPFNLSSVSKVVSCQSKEMNKTNIEIHLKNDFSNEAELLFTVCMLSTLVLIITIFVYIKFREDYESSGTLPRIDFVVSVVLAVVWIACFGAWGYSQSQLKTLTHPNFLKTDLHFCQEKFADSINCLTITRGSVLGLTESLIFSFLDFFMWAASLWFVYKETTWFLSFQHS